MILATLVELSHCRLTQIKGHSTLLSNKIELKTFSQQLFTKCPHPRFNKRLFRNSTNSVNNQSFSVNITDKKITKRKFMKLIKRNALHLISDPVMMPWYFVLFCIKSSVSVK